MGKRFLRSIVQNEVVVAATGAFNFPDLPVNPLSLIIFTILLERPNEAAVSAHRLLSDCYLGVSDISVTHKGEQIIQGSLPDLAMMCGVINGYSPGVAFPAAVGQLQAATFVLPFGRMPYWHDEAFPATQRGNLRLNATVADISPGTATAMSFQVEAVELIEDDPRQYLKYTTLTRPITATGRQRTPLPIGNDLLGILLFNPSTEITATEQSAWDRVKLMVDNVEQYYGESQWESLRADVGMRLQGANMRFSHVHPHAAADTSTGDPAINRNEPPNQYGYMDLDPLKDGTYALETQGHADIALDLNPEAASVTARYLPLELVKVR